METNQEYYVKVKRIVWSNYILTLRENDFQLKKVKARIHKETLTYTLMNAVVIDESERNDLRIMVSTSFYRIYIKPNSLEDKRQILSKLEEKIQRQSSKTAFSANYFEYLKKLSEKEPKTPYDTLLFKLNTFQILTGEIDLKLNTYKQAIKEKLSGNVAAEFMHIYNDMNLIVAEMKTQFEKIMSGVNRYFVASNNEMKNSMIESDSGSDKEEKAKEIAKRKSVFMANEANVLRKEVIEYYNKDYDFPQRTKLENNIKCPENLIKEMISTYTKKQSSPVYFNEPLSMLQKQCEKFVYLDLLTQASNIENNKPLQMCYVAAFMIGEIFTNLGRFLKPFTPILGETFEFFENSKKFRYYAENVKRIPQVTAFIGETPDFGYYGDTSNDTSFKFLKGSMDLTFKNPINIIFKKANNHYIYNRPIISVKGLLKPPMYSDYSGTTVIKDIKDNNIKLELNFLEQSWTNSTLGGFEGKAYSGEDEVAYLIGGNWQEQIYITDKDGNNKQVLLELNKGYEYLKNTLEKYTIPPYSCNLNNTNENLLKSLPKNDSRFRQDIKLLEEGNTQRAQMFKCSYEEKQKNEITDSGHKILFFDEKIDIETDENYYVPNGKYWEMKQNDTLGKNENWNIFEVDEYMKKEEEKAKSKKK